MKSAGLTGRDWARFLIPVFVAYGAGRMMAKLYPPPTFKQPQAATIATTPPAEKLTSPAKSATAEPKRRVRVHQCPAPNADHFVLSAPGIFIAEERAGLLDHAVHDWTKLNAGKLRVRTALAFIRAGNTESVHIWADPIAPTK